MVPHQPASAWLVDVPYTTQHYYKRKRQEEKYSGSYVRKTNKIMCKQCQQDRDSTTHQQCFDSWYCQATAAMTLAEWGSASSYKALGAKLLLVVTNIRPGGHNRPTGWLWKI